MDFINLAKHFRIATIYDIMFFASMIFYILLSFERDLFADCRLQRNPVMAANVVRIKNTKVHPMGITEFHSSLKSSLTSF